MTTFVGNIFLCLVFFNRYHVIIKKWFFIKTLIFGKLIIAV